MSLYLRITLIIAFTAVAVGGFTSWIANGIVTDAYIEAWEHETEAVTQTLRDTLTTQVINREKLPVQKTLQNIVSSMEDLHFAFVVGFDGEIFAHTFEGGFPKGLVVGIRHDATHSSSHLENQMVRDGDKSILMTGSMLIEGMRAHVHLGFDNARLMDAKMQAQNRIWSVTMMVVLCSILVGVLAVRVMTRHLKTLSDRIAEFGHTGTDELPPLTGGGPEVQGLVSAIRQMMESRQRVEERLEVANKQLEGFAYSVSHDLRAPLRAVDGFSAALVEDYEEKLDGQAKTYLQYLREGAQKMAQLIDDILKLSRLTRAEMVVEPTDLSMVAMEVAEEIMLRDPGRENCFEIEPELVAEADMRLMKVVLENLLGNAWKFTAGRSEPRIVVGREEQDGKPVFLVRDNGAGFNMDYADKLFVPFQRLHSNEEFEGTGIGLSTVHQVIDRHGGRIWAEGVVDQGATFYFELP